MIAPGGEDTAVRSSKWVVALLVSGGIFIALLDTTIVDIVLPKMMPALDADIYGIQWVVITYFLGSAIAMTAIGWAAEVIGHRDAYMVGAVLFVGMSILSGMAQSLPMMLTSRFFQGVGEGIMIPVGLVILYETFPPEEHGLAMGLYGLAASFAPALGPSLGGLITEHLTWRWVFFINVPVGLVDVFLVWWFLANRRAKEEPEPFDVVGFALLATAFSSLIVFLGKGEEKGWLSSDFIVHLVLVFAVSAVAAGLWLAFARHPLFPRRILGHRPFRFGLLVMALLSINAYGFYLLLPIYLQRLRGYTTLQAGLILLPGALLGALTTLASGVLSDRINPRWVAVLFLAGSAVGSWAFHTDLDTARHVLVLDYIFWGLFIGGTFAPVTLIALATLEDRDLSDGSTLVNVVRLIAGSVGTSYATALLTSRTDTFYEAMTQNLTWGSYGGREIAARLRQLTGGLGRYFDPDAWHRFLAAGHGLIERRAASYAFHATYEHLALVMVVACLLVLAIRTRPHRVSG